MKRSYRGVNYIGEPSTLEVTEGEIGGLYRGQNWRFHYAKHMPEPLPSQNLQYRGVAYRNSQPAVPVLSKQEESVTPIARWQWSNRHKREVLDELTRSHLQNIRRSLEHRLQVAKAKGDEQLVRMLEKESEQLTLPAR